MIEDKIQACAICGGPYQFDTTVPSCLWNAVVRARELPEYLCTTCIVRIFVSAGQSFTAELWGAEFSGVPIEVRVASVPAVDAALIQRENNRLRAALHATEANSREVPLRTGGTLMVGGSMRWMQFKEAERKLIAAITDAIHDYERQAIGEPPSADAVDPVSRVTTG